VLLSRGLSIRPRAMPAAGACSVFVTTIKKIAAPTASPPKTISAVSLAGKGPEKTTIE